MIIFKDGSKLNIADDKITACAINSDATVLYIDVGSKRYEINKWQLTDESWQSQITYAGFE